MQGGLYLHFGRFFTRVAQRQFDLTRDIFESTVVDVVYGKAFASKRIHSAVECVGFGGGRNVGNGVGQVDVPSISTF